MDLQPKHIIDGFSEDLQRLASKFGENFTDHKLVDFLKLWDEEHLDCLFANRFDPRELIEAISEINIHLTQVLVSTASDNVLKTVAIYLLLCIHIKQPERFRCKFRWTCLDLTTIESWCNSIVDNPDSRRALRQLKALKAFDLVEEHSIYGPSLVRKKGAPKQIRSSPLTEDRKETLEYIESRIEPTLSELRQIHAGYDQFRQALQLTGTSAGVYLEQAADSLGQFKSGIISSQVKPI